MIRVTILFLIFGLVSCRTEKHFFKNSLTKSEKEFLMENESLTKQFSGKANWYKQYWKGDLLVLTDGNKFNFLQLGEWKQISKDGEVVATRTFEEGTLRQEKVFDQGNLIFEMNCHEESSDTLLCSTRNYNLITLKVYSTGNQLKIGDKILKTGEWKFFDDLGEVQRTEHYLMNKLIKK